MVSSWFDRSSLTLLALALSLGGILLPFWPGLVTYDANSTIYEAENGIYRDWWSPFLSFVWGPLLDAGNGVGAVFFVQTVMVVAGVYLSMRLLIRRVPAAIGTSLICAYPPFYAQLSGPSRDGFYLGFTMLSFGFLSQAVRSQGRRRWCFALFSFLAAVGSSLSRQNGIAAVFVIAALLVLLVCRDPSWRPQRPRLSARRLSPLLSGVLALAIGGTVTTGVLAATLASYTAGDVVETHPERLLYIYDLAAISTGADENMLPPDLRRQPPGVFPPDATSLATLERRFEYANVITLYPDGNWMIGDLHDETLAAREEATLREAWWDAVRAEPGAYLANRLKLWTAQLGFGHRPQDAYLGMVEPTNFGNPPVISSGYLAASDYVSTFVGPTSTIPLDTVWPYVVGSTVLGAFIWRRLRWRAAPVVMMVATVWTTMASLALTAMAAGFRYMTLAVPVALIVGVFAVALGRRDRDSLRSLVERSSTPVTGWLPAGADRGVGSPVPERDVEPTGAGGAFAVQPDPA